jgi:ankyrin repeat protein
MTRALPPHPSLDHLKKQAKQLLRDVEAGDPAARERLAAFVSRAAAGNPKLADAQHAIARDYGFDTWPKLKAHVDSLATPTDALERLSVAVQANETAEVVRLLARERGLHARLDEALAHDRFGTTALIAAVQHANRDVVDALLAAGANINQRSHWWAGGFGVLDNDRGLAPYLIERGALVDANAAAALGMVERLERLLAEDPSRVHARGGDGQTPLHVAANVAVATLLLEHGAEIDALDVDHESTPAQYAVRDHQDVARLLVERGGRSDVLLVSALGDVERVRRHLDDDPEVIRTSVSDRWFPKRNPHSGGTIYFWKLGTNRTAHVVAREFHRDDVYRLLMERSSDELKLALACELGDEAAFAALLAARPNLVSTLSGEERLKLSAAAQANNTDAVRLMLAAGWPVDARGPLDGTALHWAAFHGNVAMAREILKHGPSLEIRDGVYSQPPMGWAMHGSLNGWHRATGDYGATVEALLEAGAAPPPSTDDSRASSDVTSVLEKWEASGPRR